MYICIPKFTFPLNHTSILKSALDTIAIEQKSIENLANYINDDFANAIQAIHESSGRLVVSGIGKSAIIAQKIVATLNSTGTPALFMHAADAIHGDLGMTLPADIVMVISKSGETAEIKLLMPLIRSFGNKIIALCGSKGSFLARHSDYFINSTVDSEACPNNLAPTSSTTAQMVMGDAMAVCLLKLKGFTPEDFAKFHPGGSLGKRLYMKVQDLSQYNAKPSVFENTPIKDVIMSITSNRLGATVVVNENDEVVGIITDGDIRRMLEKHDEFTTLMAKDIMNATPKKIQGEELAVHALHSMRRYNVSQLIALNDKTYAGIVHIHDLMREGII
jgi:arabinose-5-phosphate isomerase